MYSYEGGRVLAACKGRCTQSAQFVGRWECLLNK